MGDAIQVRYLVSDPTVSTIPDGARSQEPPVVIFLIMPFFFLAIFGAMFWPPIGEVFKARRLFKTGRVATASVIFVKRRSGFTWPGMPGSNASQVYMRMQSSSGATREVVASCYNDWLIGQLSPGTTVHVAYRDDGSNQAALLDAFVR